MISSLGTWLWIAWRYLIVLSDILLQKFRIAGMGHIDTVGDSSLKRRVILITGPTSGIGKAVAWALAKRQALIVLACRNRAKGERVKKEFLQKSEDLGIEPPSLEVAMLDVSNLQSVRNLIQEWRNLNRPLHVLINNAGIFDIAGCRKVDSDGMEQHMVTNFLGPFYLTLGLLPCLEKTARTTGDARIVNLSSVMHHIACLDINDPFLESPGSYSSDKAYSQSKLASILFGSELKRRLPVDSGVTVYSAHPGEAVTDVARGLPVWNQWIYKNVFRYILMTPEQGARSSVYCATAGDAVLESVVTGGYFGSNARPEMPSKEARCKEMAKTVWNWAVEKTQLPVGWNLAEGP